MLGDRTNRLHHQASPSVLKPLKYSLGLENEQKAAKSTFGGFVEPEQARPTESVADEDEVELKSLREEQSNIQLSTKFDYVFGDVNERTAYDAYVLKRQPPEQKIFGYPAEYLKQETGRLSEGFKKLRTQRDNLLRELLDIHAKQEIVFEKVSTMVSKMRLEKVDILKKVAELEKRLKIEVIQSEKAKAALGKEAEQVVRLEQACEQARLALAECERLSADCEAKERDARKRAENAERLVLAQGEELQKMKDDILRSQQNNEECVRKQALDLESEINAWRKRETFLEQEVIQVKARLEEIRTSIELYNNQMNSLRQENQKKESQIESMRERAVNAEEKLNVKDGNVNLALQALRESQDLNQVRIDTLNNDKIRLEQKVEEMLAEKKSCMDKVYEASGQLDRLRDQEEQLTTAVLELERTLMESTNSMNSAMDNLETARADAASKTAKYIEARDQLERTLEQVNVEKAKFTDASKEAAVSKSRVVKLQEELNALNKTLEKLSNSPRKMEKILEKSKEEESLKKKISEADQYRDEVEQLTQELKQLNSLLFQSDAQRRSLLNEVQSIKGNIRVVARVRPPMTDTTGLRDDEITRINCSVDGMGLALDIRSSGDHQQRKKETHSFQFNRVFDLEASQHVVFEEVSCFVQSALDGYNVCLFSYGQTGSGKTYTMIGDLANPVTRGLIPRSADFIMYSIAQMREKGWTYDVECSFLEIHNENIRDLLADPSQEKTSRHDILHRGGNIVVTGIRRVPLHEAEEVYALLEQAEKLRVNVPMEKSAYSSRSHSIFTIHLVGRSADKTSAELIGSLSLCDLAGSERSHTGTHSTAELGKDSQGINTSLSNLVAVLTNSTQKSSQLSYKSSTLTHILSPCLSGEGKTMLIVNVSSDHDDASESLATLRFAEQVNKTELGKAKKNVREQTAPTGALVNRGRNNSQ